VQGKEFFIDPGTYAYHTEKKWRGYFKGTSAHNTLRIDYKDQSLSGGNFMWIKKADSNLLKFEELDNAVEVSGKHNGYENLKAPVSHERNVLLNKMDSEYIVTDRVKCRDNHIVEQFWHLCEHCEIENVAVNHFIISNGERKISIKIDDAFEVKVEKGNESAPLGWVSRSFDSKIPAYTLVGSTLINGDKEFTTTIMTKFN
jgi:hypothetical protein